MKRIKKKSQFCFEFFQWNCNLIYYFFFPLAFVFAILPVTIHSNNNSNKRSIVCIFQCIYIYLKWKTDTNSHCFAVLFSFPLFTLHTDFSVLNFLCAFFYFVFSHFWKVLYCIVNEFLSTCFTLFYSLRFFFCVFFLILSFISYKKTHTIPMLL